MRNADRLLNARSSAVVLVTLVATGCGTEEASAPSAAAPAALESALGAVRGEVTPACDEACVVAAVDAYAVCIETADRGEAACVDRAVAAFIACAGTCADETTDDTASSDGSANGVYRGYFCSGELFIETLDIDRADALENCQLNAASNPGRGVFCTFDDALLLDGCEVDDRAPTSPGACEDWEPRAFGRAAERFDLTYWETNGTDAAPFGETGAEFVRFNARYGLWVGLVEVAGGYRFYLSDSLESPFLPAADFGGHGQDLCELVDPTFALPNEDDITSGGCSMCSTGRNVSLLGVEVYTRGAFGEPFARRLASEWGADQTSVIDCGIGPVECGARSTID